MATKKKKGQKPKKRVRNDKVKIIKSSSKSSSKTKNSVSKPISATSAPPKRRTYRALPDGYRVTRNARVEDGVVEIHNGKPLFKKDKDGKRRIATDRNGNPAHKKAFLVVDPQAHEEAQKEERKSKYLRKDEVRMYNNPKYLSKEGKPHPARISAKHNNAYKFNVITHGEKFFNKPTVELAENPNKNKTDKQDNRPSRASVSRWENKHSFSKKKAENWRFSKEDKKRIKKHSKKYEKKDINK